MEKRPGMGPIVEDKRPIYTESFARSSKAIGVLWGVFTVCFAVVVVVVFIQPQWIGHSHRSKSTGSFGLWQRCTSISSPADSLLGGGQCVGELDDLSQLSNLAFRSATILVGASVASTLLSIACFLLFFFFSPATVFNITGFIQLIAALCLTTGVCIYPLGFDSAEVMEVCGVTARAYNVGDCEVRWAYLLAILGVLDVIGLSSLAFILGSRSLKLKHHIFMQQHHHQIEPIYDNFYKGPTKSDYIGDGMSLTDSRKSLNLQPVVMFPGAEMESRSDYSYLPKNGRGTALFKPQYAASNQAFQL